MNKEYDFQKYKNMTIEELEKSLEEQNRLSELFLKRKEDLTQEEKEILQKEIAKSDNSEYIPFEELMEELYQFAEELKSERIQNKVRLKY